MLPSEELASVGDSFSKIVTLRRKLNVARFGLGPANRSIRQTRIRTPERVREGLRFALLRTDLCSSQQFE